MTFPVVWLDAHPLCWDQGFVDETLTRLGGEHVVGWDALPDDAPGAVVVVPARYHVDRVDEINDRLGRLDWAVVVLTSDEESTFPWEKVSHPNMRLWVMTPRPSVHDEVPGRRFLPHGCPPDTTRILGEQPSAVEGRRVYDWSFAGQVNHPRRRAAVAAMRKMRRGKLLPSKGFTQGLPRDDYLALLAETKVAVCPSGPQTPDTFRLWEALEAGCVPVADRQCPAYGGGYWPLLLGNAPFPGISDWALLRQVTAELVAEWPTPANRTWSWWQGHKRNLRKRIAEDVNAVGGGAAFPTRADGPDRAVTVLIPTSPIPSHPSTAIIEETVASVRHWLPDAELIVMVDGVREEQDNRRAAYEAYQHELLRLCQHEWGNAVPVRFDSHHHQAGMTRRVLDMVTTPLLLFVEHDTPLVTDEPIDWPAACAPLLANHLDVLRFHHESHILDVHQYLMVDQDTPKVIDGCPVWRTAQWSQRPHLARTDYYRWVINRNFPQSSNTYIEDKLHSVAQSGSWYTHRIGVYAPSDTNIKRSLHSDGRGDDDKFDCRFQ